MPGRDEVRPSARFGTRRTRRQWSSVRLSLTLWNVAVLSLILAAFGAVVRYAVQINLFASVDRQLAERAHPLVLFIAPSLHPGRPGLRGVLGTDGAGLPLLPGAERAPLRGPMSAPVGRLTKDAPHLVAATRPPGGVVVTSGAPAGAPDLLPRVLSREPARNPERGSLWDQEPWDRRSLTRSFAGREVYSTVHVRGKSVRVLSQPVETRGRVEHVLQVPYPLENVERELRRLTSTLLALAPLALAAAGLGGALLTGRALRPVREISESAASMGANDLSRRLPVSGGDEFAEMSASFNAMLARLEEAFDRQRRFTADASHELRTPLSIIRANTGLALEQRWPEERYREFLAAIDAVAGRQSRIVEELLFLARADAGVSARDVGSVCLLEALEEAAEAVSRPDRPGIRLEPLDPGLMVPGSGSELTRLFTNLLENAARHTPPEGRVTVSATVEATSVTVTVTDTGEGIAPEHLTHLGERFYRVDAARSGMGGTGLGLAICRSIIDAHGGRMTIESQLGEGTTVQVRLPLGPP